MKKLIVLLSLIGVMIAAPVGGGNELIKGKLRIDTSGTSMTFSEKLLVNGSVTINGGIKAQTITANYFVGNGSLLTGLSASGGGITTANADSRYISNNQTTVVSINADFKASRFFGDGSGLTGVVGGSGISTTNADLRYAQLSANQVITASFFVGDGSKLSNLPAASGGGITTVNADLRYAPISLVGGILTANADLRYAPISVISGILTANADARYISANQIDTANIKVNTANYSVNSSLLGGKAEASLVVATASKVVNYDSYVVTTSFVGSVTITTINASAMFVGNRQFSVMITTGNTYYGDFALVTIDVNTVGYGGALRVSADGRFTDINCTTTKNARTVALSITGGTGANQLVMLSGFISRTGWNWTSGNPVYGSTSAGQLTQTIPSTSGNGFHVVGIAISPKMIRFNPDNQVIQIQ